MSEESIAFEGRKYVGLTFPLGNLPLLIVKARKGYVACSYLDKATAEHLGDVAAFVSGVKSFDELLHAKIRHMTAWAEEMGVREGMSVKKALELMDGTP
ncbi:MAG: DUF1805 domain-containing protein [Candidatus Micrarchaeota archaeon]|nr:DUF1805 domain-containing protein [Candidatus Micrarchaeota archaeon]